MNTTTVEEKERNLGEEMVRLDNKKQYIGEF
jgi:hypothetical protein